MLALFLKNIDMKNDEFLLRLKKIVKPYVQNEEAFNNLTEETDFINDLKINSANLVDIVLDVEDEFDIEIDNDSMEKMLSVHSALAIIEQKLIDKNDRK
jgi:acyl carrier protein